MNLPIETTVWRKSAEMTCFFIKRVCAVNPTRYGCYTVCQSSGPLEQIKRGIKCTNQQFLWRSPCYSDYRLVTALSWINSQPTASPRALRLALLGPFCWTEIRSKAPLSVALLVASPAKTDSFGSNRSLGRFVRIAFEPLSSFISPLLNPLRGRVWGSYSCLNALFAHECPALSNTFGPIKGETYV